jgi:hypothetical protein
MLASVARSSRDRACARKAHGLGPPSVGVARTHANLAAIDANSRTGRAKREPAPFARGMTGNASRGAVGARGAPVARRAHEARSGAIDRVLVTEVPVFLARDETAALAPTGARRRAARVAGSFAHRHLLSVPVDMGLAARAGRAGRSFDLPLVAR